MANYLSTYLLLVFLVVNATDSFAQKISVESSEHTAGFSYTTESSSTDPVIHYQQTIEMLASMTDKATLSIYADGRVLVHYPVYMKKAGDYEMRLDDAELKNLIRNLSTNGIMDFDENKVKGNVDAYKKALRAKGQLYKISDATVTKVDISLGEYQKNKKSKKIKNFRKQFRWKNIEYDARLYRNDIDITKANNSIMQLKGMMKDTRLVRRNQR